MQLLYAAEQENVEAAHVWVGTEHCLEESQQNAVEDLGNPAVVHHVHNQHTVAEELGSQKQCKRRLALAVTFDGEPTYRAT